MSQFILCNGELNNINLKNNIEIIQIEEDSFLSSAADDLFPGYSKKNIWSVIEKNTKNIDSIFTKAQREVGEGRHFNETELSELLKSLISSNISFCLWYGDDWGDLSSVSKDEIFKHIETELMEMPGEIYLMYIAE